MTTAVYRSGATFGEARSVVSRSQAVVLLQLFALTVMLIPSDAVIKAIGAGGYAAALVGMFAFAAYLAAIMLGLHNLSEHRNPIRIVLCLLWLSVLASYVLMNRSILTVPELASADRQLMQLAVISGAALVAAEWVNSLSDIRRVLRALCWGGAFAGVVATLQFWLNLDLAVYLRDLPGFSLNYDNAGILVRDGLNRVSGTAIYPIELGVVAGMLLPLAVYLAVYDVERSARRRWATVGLIALAIPTSVSRSAIISVGLALAVLVVLMPVRQRLVAIFTVPLGLVAVFMSAPGVIGTLTSFFTAGTSDPSVATRVSDYPLVEAFVQKAPLFGRGGGTYIADNAIDILDNQFLKTAIELGLVGVVALTIFFVVPVIVGSQRAPKEQRPRAAPALRRAGRRRAGGDRLLVHVRFAVVSDVRQRRGPRGRPDRSRMAARGHRPVVDDHPSRRRIRVRRAGRGHPSAALDRRLIMDLLTIARKIWRYRIATLPVIVLTLLGAVYMVVLKPPVYEASSSYILINPPSPPTPEEIAAKPALGRIDPDNPFTRFSDQSVVVGLLSSILSNDVERKALVKQGADSRYTVAPVQSTYGYSSLMLGVTGVGSSGPQAIRTAELVGAALNQQLENLQASRGVAPHYRIKSELIDAPDTASQKVSGKLRALIGVFVLGVILLFVVISAAEGLATLRAEWAKRDAPGSRRSRARSTAPPRTTRRRTTPGTTSSQAVPAEPPAAPEPGLSRRFVCPCAPGRRSIRP